MATIKVKYDGREVESELKPNGIARRLESIGINAFDARANLSAKPVTFQSALIWAFLDSAGVEATVDAVADAYPTIAELSDEAAKVLNALYENPTKAGAPKGKPAR